MDRESTILQHLPIVHSTAETLIRDGIPRHYKDDLVSEGIIALIKVIDGPAPRIPIKQRIARRCRDAMLALWKKEKRYIAMDQPDDLPDPREEGLPSRSLRTIDGEDDYGEESYP